MPHHSPWPLALQEYYALEECLGTWGKTLSLQRWLDVIASEADGPARVELLEALLGERAEALPALLAELGRTRSSYPALMTKLLLDVTPPLSPEELLPAWDAWMAAASGPEHVWLGTSQDLDGLLERFAPRLDPAACQRLLAEDGLQ